MKRHEQIGPCRRPRCSSEGPLYLISKAGYHYEAFLCARHKRRAVKNGMTVTVVKKETKSAQS